MIGEALPVGTREPDGYLERYARQHAETKVSQTYVAVNGAAILGYYSLAMSAIRVD
jgi:predicted Rossmann fold nucleotide-binding protein DprA/Smf involved in DNA uptake